MTSEECRITKEDLRAEYLDCGTNWRYWGDVRFKQLTVFLTANGVLGAGVLSLLGSAKKNQGSVKAFLDALPLQNQAAAGVLAICGLALCLCFLLLEERATCYRRAYVKHAVRIEEELGVWQYRCTKIEASVRSNTVYAVLFLVVGDIWVGLILSILSGDLSDILLYVFIASIVTIVMGVFIRRQLMASSTAHLEGCPKRRLGPPVGPETIEQTNYDNANDGATNREEDNSE